MKNIGKYLLLIVLILIGFQASISFHELGHCVFYWVQGIPCKMSWVKEFPMCDISVKQYQIGSWGGIIFNWILLIFIYFISVQFYKKNKTTPLYFSKVFYYSSFITIFIYVLFLLKGKDKFEFIYAQNLLNLPHFSIIVFSMVLISVISYFFIKKLKLTIRSMHIGLAILVMFFSILYVALIESYDLKNNWKKYPAVKVGNEFIYNKL